MTYIIVSIVLLAVADLVSYIPARRADAVDSVETLRCEQSRISARTGQSCRQIPGPFRR
jgi:hypothetical protein